jgi:septal ring factor EnvC (AmiA/AmiB activator)
MRTRSFILFPLVLLTCAPLFLPLAQSVESVTSQKERCLRKLEKVERSLETITAGIERVSRLRQASKEGGVSSDAFIEKSQSKVEYLNNRIERARNQLEKIESDLQKAGSGNQCPSCIASDVNLFCRHAESLYTENSDLMNDVAAYERTLRASVSANELCDRTDALLASLDSSIRKTSTGYRAATALLAKARDAMKSNEPAAAMAFALEANDSAAAIPSGKKAPCALGPDIERISKRLNKARESASVKDTSGKAERILAKAQEHIEKGKARCSAGKTEEARTELSIAEKFITTAIDQAGAGKEQ